MMKKWGLGAVLASCLSACGPTGMVASANSTPAESFASPSPAPSRRTDDKAFRARVSDAASWLEIAMVARRDGDGALYFGAMEQASASLAGIDRSPGR